MLDHHSALIHTMVIMSAADGDMTDNEMSRIAELIRFLPIFGDYDSDRFSDEVVACAEALATDDGLDQVLDRIVSGLPAKLAETAYAVACDVAAADGHVGQEEARLLELLRHALDVDRLAAAGIERGARARHMTL